MDVKFSSLTIENTNSTDIKVTVEAPVGTVVLGPENVPKNSTRQFDPAVKNVASARIIAGFDRDHAADETITLSGDSQRLYIEEVAGVLADFFSFKALTVKGSI